MNEILQDFIFFSPFLWMVRSMHQGLKNSFPAAVESLDFASLFIYFLKYFVWDLVMNKGFAFFFRCLHECGCILGWLSQVKGGLVLSLCYKVLVLTHDSPIYSGLIMAHNLMRNAQTIYTKFWLADFNLSLAQTLMVC